MNIVFVYLKAFSKTGGIEAFNKKFIRSLEEITQACNAKITIISLYDNQEDYLPNSNSIKYIGLSGNRILAFKILIQNVKFNSIVFYGHINLILFANILYLFRINKNAYFIVHGIDVWHRFNLGRRFLMNCFSYLAVSNYTKKMFSEKNGVNKEKIVLFPNCIDSDYPYEIFKNPYSKEEFNILTVTRLDEKDNYKGVDSVIKTLPIISELIPNIKYTVIGNGSDKLRLEKLAFELGVKDKVDFKGFVEIIDSYYQYCDLFILPSNGEGFGIVYLEAMKYRKAIIAANACGSTDVVLNQITGLLCNYDDQLCLAENILKLYINTEYNLNLGINGFNYLMNNFTFEHFRDRLFLILETHKIK
jgi:glycosyltransferase involved in cell wall biosynthesis